MLRFGGSADSVDATYFRVTWRTRRGAFPELKRGWPMPAPSGSQPDSVFDYFLWHFVQM